GTQGTYLTLALSSVTLSAARVSILAPDGSTLVSTTFGTSGVTLNPLLPTTGTYSVLIDPTGAIGGALTISASSSSTPTLTVNGTTNISITGTNTSSSTFRAGIGQYLAVGVNESCGFVAGATITVLQPNGATLATGSFSGVTGVFGCSYIGS